MRRRGRRGGESALFGLAFLDVICCGFGAILLLLVLSKIGEPRVLEASIEDLEGRIARLQEELVETRGRSETLRRDLRGRREQISEEREQVARLRGDLSEIQGEFAATRELSEVKGIVEGRLVAALQELTEEMKRLRARSRRRVAEDRPIGGIPVDSEYVIFIVDTSGSMKTLAWPLVVQKMEETLEIYPRVEGIQVMNDMGQYMFSYYEDKWIPDTPARRRAILDRLRGWEAFSNSSPVEGITRAIGTFATRDKKISLYVFGDEFTGSSIQHVLDTVERLNPRDAEGRRLVRIHAVGFPTVFSHPTARDYTGERFATLMRVLCEANDGSFVALPSTRP